MGDGFGIANLKNLLDVFKNNTKLP